MKVPKGSWIIVADAGKYLVLVNDGGSAQPDYRCIDKATLDNPPSRELGADRPGRMGTPSSPGGTFENTDWHDLAEEHWTRDLADKLDAWAMADRFDSLVIVAAPVMLGQLRDALTDRVKQRLIGDVAKDLTHHPVAEIASLIADA